MIHKIISGGQTGADQGALRGAMGIDTGGTAPQGFRTETGPAPWLGTVFQLEEGPQSYAERTRMNVLSSDGTLIISAKPSSPGTRCTIECCQKEGMPYLLIDVLNKLKDPEVVAEVLAWIEEHDIQTLNVAGNRESVSPGISNAVRDFVRRLLEP